MKGHKVLKLPKFIKADLRPATLKQKNVALEQKEQNMLKFAKGRGQQ